MTRIERVEEERDVALHESENLRKILDRITDGFFALDRNWTLLYVNRRFEEIIGVGSEEIVGENLLERFPELEDSVFHRRYAEALEEGRTVSFEGHYAPFSQSYRVRAYPSGEGLSVFFEDVTERREQERELERSAARYRSLTEDVVDRSPIGTVISDAAGTVLWVSRAFEHLFDVTREKWIGAHYRQLVEDRLAPYLRHSASVLPDLLRPPSEDRRGGPSRSPLVHEKGGERRWIEHRVSPIQTGLYAGGRLDQFRDFTDQHRLEVELVNVASREQRVIGGELHDDVGQKLTGAVYMLEALEARLVAEQKVENRDLRAIRKILLDTTATTRRISRGLFRAELEDQPIGDALSQLARDVEEMFEVRCSFHATAPVCLDVESAVHLFRIVQELITNAVRHGMATWVSIILGKADGVTEVVVCHDGDASEAQGNGDGVGLRLIRYRAKIIGAFVDTSIDPAGHTCSVCRLPLEPEP